MLWGHYPLSSPTYIFPVFPKGNKVTEGTYVYMYIVLSASILRAQNDMWDITPSSITHIKWLVCHVTEWNKKTEQITEKEMMKNSDLP